MIIIHSKDKNKDNFRFQCSECGKWKRAYSIKEGKIKYNYCNVEDKRETICTKCYTKNNQPII